ncbi:MAG: cytochrome c3 family protein [Magnetococcales bacterium]|nr:cytochrome c3 family protein [Magnetococcales bacterium]
MDDPVPSQENYERPNHPWICGRAIQGNACRSGPDHKGHCGGQSECRPVRRGDRWHCARPALAGGPCPEGPSPEGQCGRPLPTCQPVRNLRGLRRLLARWSILVAVGLILSITYGNRVLEFISPGPLSPFHSSIDNCIICHAAAEKGPRGWIKLALGRPDIQPDNLRCLKCHPLGTHAQSPHSLDPQVLKKLEPKVAEWPDPPPLPVSLHMAAPLLNPDLGRQHPLSCGLCHQEHQGHFMQETWWAQDRCNSCHRKATSRFDQDHPRFVDYPHQEQTSIKFNHRTHFQKHFHGKLADKAPKNCSVCHPDNGRNNMVSSIHFQPACGTCHIDQIREVFQSGPKGLKVLSLPPLDLDVLRQRGVAIGEWPGNSDGDLSPFMPGFFHGYPEFETAFAMLNGMDTLNLTTATDSQLTAIATLVWNIKEFVFELLISGRPALAKRWQNLLGERPDYHLLAQLSGQMPADLVRSIQKEWFPHLLEEMAMHRQGKPVPIPNPHSATPATDTVEKRGSPDGDKGGLLDSDKGGLLDNDDKGGLLDSDKGGLLDNDDKGGLLDSDKGNQTPTLRPLTDDAWIEGGGWYREGYSLYYLPTGHEDGFLRTWLDTLFSRQQSSSAAQRLFQLLIAEKTAGQCGKCHFGAGAYAGAQTGAHAGASLEMTLPKWRGRVAPLDAKEFRKFSHTAHQSLIPRCQDCHPFTTAPLPETPPGATSVVHSGFAQLEKMVCAKCHQPDKAGDACLLCHNYHVGQKSSARGRSR